MFAATVSNGLGDNPMGAVPGCSLDVAGPGKVGSDGKGNIMILELMIMKARFFLAGMINYLTSIDIVTAIVRATVAATFAYVFGKILNPYFDEPLKKFRFMLDCTELVEKFGKEVEKLKAMEKKVQEQIGSAKENGDKLLSDVKKWVEETEKEIITGDKFVEDFKESEKAIYRCCGIVWSHWGILYSSGKEATDKTSILVRLLKDGKRFESKVSNPTPPPNRLDVYQSENFCHTTTQELALNQILTTIEDENIQIIGIYGMGGVGKTTLAMAVAARSKTDFDLVAIITVTQKADETKIEKDAEIAKKRIQEGDKVLIIIDDVWEALNLEDLGIQHGPNCKILLTSRSKDVCVDMYAQKIICVEPLTTEEAMHLFKHVVGENVVMESESNNNVAMEIVKECGGLPLIIKVAGNSLKNRDVNEWMRALTQVRKNVPVHISLSMKRAFSHLKLSYDYLEDEEVQWCFLMCSMFREDESILLEDLVFYGVGLGKFNRLDTMEDARQRVRDAVNILTSSGLLLNVDDKCKTKMHDVVRDVALLIASKGKNNLLVEAGKGLTNWLPRNTQVELHTGISLTKNKIVKLPDKQIHFRRLEAFIMDDNKFDMVNSEEFFRGMRKLKVLNLARNYIESLPQSLKLLTKLRMLNLDGNSYLVEIKILGMLKDLEILNISRTGIREIPQDIGELENLRRLEVINCRLLNYVTPGVISNLWRLEELFIELKDRVTTAELKLTWKSKEGKSFSQN
ncbi:disease resistance protein UNI-like [Rutidosis leptorrhynchoides]|uniref:disease resistance protein UNI-like n=1 Tax=Rutidosis leptorrhynchoides TaxID=125765 RepID=UPI003A998BB2